MPSGISKKTRMKGTLLVYTDDNLFNKDIDTVKENTNVY